MILADKIIEERKRNGWSQEELADQLGVSRQAVSKWESAGSIPDLQKIIQLAELFGVSTDYLLKDEMEPSEPSAPVTVSGEAGTIRRVSMEEANEFLESNRKGAPVIANGVLLCILSPALLIVLSGLADGHIGNISEALAAGLGLLALFTMIATAVFLFITYGIRESHKEHLKAEPFETEYGVSGMVREKKKAYEETYIRGIAVGVVLCIASVVPLILAALAEFPDYVICIFVALLLGMIAIGVNLIIRVSMVKESYDVLLQEGEFTRVEKKANRKLDPFYGAYWSIVTAIYLGWSFWSMRWDYTWIIWPVAGVLFGAVTAILKGVMASGQKD